MSAPPDNDPGKTPDQHDPFSTSGEPVAPHPGVSTVTFYPDEAAGTMIGPYKLLQLMGKGGMGAVWMAEQTEPVKRRVAVKIIKLAVVALEFLKHNEHRVAEPMLRECLEIRVQSQPEAASTFNAKSLLGACLLGQKKYGEAEPLLKEGYEGMKQREKTTPPESLPRLTEALARLVQLYAATGNAAEAERYRKELAERKAAQKEPKK